MQIKLCFKSWNDYVCYDKIAVCGPEHLTRASVITHAVLMEPDTEGSFCALTQSGYHREGLFISTRWIILPGKREFQHEIVQGDYPD